MLYNAVSRIGIATLQPLDTPFRMTVPTHIVTDVCMYVSRYSLILSFFSYTHTHILPLSIFPLSLMKFNAFPPLAMHGGAFSGWVTSVSAALSHYSSYPPR